MKLLVCVFIMLAMTDNSYAQNTSRAEENLKKLGITLPDAGDAGRKLRHLGARRKPPLSLRSRSGRRYARGQSRQGTDARAGRPGGATDGAESAGDDASCSRQPGQSEARRQSPGDGQLGAGICRPAAGHQWVFRSDGAGVRRGHWKARPIGGWDGGAAQQHPRRDRDDSGSRIAGLRLGA